MNTDANNMTDFLNNKSALKGMNTELAVALMSMLGGEQAFLDSLIDDEETGLLHQVKIFGEHNQAIVMRFYEKNHQSFLDFLTAKSYKQHQGSAINYVSSLFLDNRTITPSIIAKALYSPTYLIDMATTEESRRAVANTHKLATMLYFQGVVHLTECYQQFVSGKKYNYKKGFMYSLEYDLEMKSKASLASLVMDRFNGGREAFILEHETLTDINASDKVPGFEDDNDTVTFFEENKKIILDLLKRIQGTHYFSGRLGAIYYELKDENFTIDDIGRGVFEPVTDNNPTNLKTAIARAAVNMSVKATAQDYALYKSKAA